MAGTKNLIKIDSTERAKELGRKGGQQFAKNCAKRREMKETLKLLLSLPSEEREEMNKETSGLIAMIEKWEKTGDKGLGEFIRDTIGEKPAERVINITPPTLIDDIQ